VILAIDPGPTPGMAYWSLMVGASAGEFKAWTADNPYSAINWMTANMRSIEEVAIEDFIIQAGGRARTTADSKATLEMIGAVDYVCHGVRVPLYRQLPSDAASFSTNEKLRAVGFETPSKPDHARSAARHLLLRLTRNGAIDPLVLIRSLQ
jgi:hypothetical protein